MVTNNRMSFKLWKTSQVRRRNDRLLKLGPSKDYMGRGGSLSWRNRKAENLAIKKCENALERTS